MAVMGQQAGWKPWPTHSWPHTASNVKLGGGPAGPYGQISSQDVDQAYTVTKAQVRSTPAFILFLTGTAAFDPVRSQAGRANPPRDRLADFARALRAGFFCR